MEREKFGSRLGFILISAGLRKSELEMYGVFHMLQAIMEVEYLFYYICYSFLCLEFLYYQWNLQWEELLKANIIRAYHELERPGQKWHIHGYLGMIGNYILLFFYTTVSGWMLGYFIKYVTGDITKTQTVHRCLLM